MTYCTGIYSIIINVCKKAIRYKSFYISTQKTQHI